jgi:hypothetical protein
VLVKEWILTSVGGITCIFLAERHKEAVQSTPFL